MSVGGLEEASSFQHLRGIQETLGYSAIFKLAQLGINTLGITINGGFDELARVVQSCWLCSPYRVFIPRDTES